VESRSTSSRIDASSRTVRIFISSTFRDFTGERDLLVRRVFPELRRRCRERQVDLVDVDLRWGITEAEAEQGKVLPICLAEIDRARPFFMGLLGERYGWVPAAGQFDRSLLIEQPWLAEHAGGKSVTELEILHGVLNNPAMAGRAFFYFRDPGWSARQGTEYASEAEREKLAALKDRIRASGFPLVEDYSDPEALAERVREDLWSLIDAAYPEADVPDPLTLERRRHEAYGGARRRLYLGGERGFEALDRELAVESPRPVLVRGRSGGGKSALVANWLARWSQAHPDTAVIVHHLGCGADAADPVRLAVRIMQEIALLVGAEFKPKSDLDEQLDQLARWLATASAWAGRTGRTVLIVLDGLDKLSDRRHLRWFPTVLPGGVRLVASCLDGEVLDAASPRLPWRELVVEPFTAAEQAQFIAEYLGRFRKQLTTEQTRLLQAHPLAANPLFLLTVLEELRVFGVHEELDQRLATILSPPPSKQTGEEPTVDDAFEHVLARIEADHGAEPVQRVMEAIWASRAGLYTDEILAIAEVPPATWAGIANSLDESLYDSSSRIGFGHHYLRKAVEDRYAITGRRRVMLHARMAAVFGAQDNFYDPPQNLEPNTRKTFELIYQLAQSKDFPALEKVVTDVEFLMGAVHRADLPAVLADIATAASALTAAGHDTSASWSGFLHANAHRISRGTDSWPASRILLQCALDEHDTTPWCQAAERWLTKGHCGWTVVRAVTQQAKTSTSIQRVRIDGTPASLALMPKKAMVVAGLLDGRLVRIDLSSQEVSPFSNRTGCIGPVACATALSETHVFATAAPNEIGIWDSHTLALISRLGHHPAPIDHLTVLDDGHLVALSLPYGSPATLSRWDTQSLQQIFLATLPATHTQSVTPFRPCCLSRCTGVPVIAVLQAGEVTCVHSDNGSVIARLDVPFSEYAPPTGLIAIGESEILCVFSDGKVGVVNTDTSSFRLISTEPTMNEWCWAAGVAATHDHLIVASSGGHVSCLDSEGEIDAEMNLATKIECTYNTTDAVLLGAPDEIIVAAPSALLDVKRSNVSHASGMHAWGRQVDHAYAGVARRLITIGSEDMIVWHHRQVVARCALSPPGSEQPGTFEGPPMVAHAISGSGSRLVTICNWTDTVELRVWDLEAGKLRHAAQPFGDVTEGFMEACVMSTCFLGGREDRIVCGHVGGAVTVVAVDEPPRMLQMFRAGSTKVYDVTAIDTESVFVLHGDTWQSWSLEPRPQLMRQESGLQAVKGSHFSTLMGREDVVQIFGRRPSPKSEQIRAPRAVVKRVKAAESNAVKLEGPFGRSWWIGEQGLTCVAANDGGELVVGDRAGSVLHLVYGNSETGLGAYLPEPEPPGTVINSIGMKFLPIPAGEFLMGSPSDCPCGDPDEEFQHRVRITKPFLLGMHQVTQSQYEPVMGENPSFFKGPDLPVEHLTWNEARRFCELLSALPEEKAAGRHYRLPTEAEWEYACRAGTVTTFNTGDTLELCKARFATKPRSSPKMTAPVGSYPPNAWGLFDMHGNVWEWTSDWFSADYFRESPVDDPQGPATGTHHTLRGGSASVEAHECRCAIRGEAGAVDGPETSTGNRYPLYGDFGIRVVCEQSRSPIEKG
jgi:formylglycine-generating enzyme required for sulfatase activity